jgi:Peptidase family M28
MKASVRARVSQMLICSSLTFILPICLSGSLTLGQRPVLIPKKATTEFSANSTAPVSDTEKHDLDAAGSPIQPAPADPVILAAVNQISARQIRHTIEALAGFKNRSTLSSMDKDLPAGQGASAAADWITETLQSYSGDCGGCMEIKRDTFTEQPQTGSNARITQPTIITNVYAVLRGKDPEQAKRVILVTGHYDSRNSDTMNTHDPAPGANDDASGVAVSLECARVLSRLNLPATLIFAAVAGEEQGLNGSAHLAKLAKSEDWQIEGVLNNDIVGGNTTPGDSLQDKFAVRVFSESLPANATPEEIRRLTALGYESDSPSRELARAVADVGNTYDAMPAGSKVASSTEGFHPVLEFRRDRFLRGGDHSSFNQEGFAAVRFTEWREDFNHQHQNVRTENGTEYGDLLKFVDFDYVARVARLNAATMAVLASAPPPPEKVGIVTRGLDNNTTLKWSHGTGGSNTTQYEVVWRETTAADWQRSLEVKAGEKSITVPVSKDNVIFGVRSIDAAGHRSVAVVPMPER